MSISRAMSRIPAFFRQLFSGELTPRMIYYHLVEKLHGRWYRDDEDDFNWSRYTVHYKGELELGARTRSLTLHPDDYSFSGGQLVHQSSRLPLHPNAHIIYETILQLQPTSVLEVGCGGGDNLYNLKILQPSLPIRGIDVSSEQLEFLAKRHPELASQVTLCDITKSVAGIEPVDLIFTNAVLMHIGTAGGRWESAVKNLFHIAKDYIILMEDWVKHEYIDLLKRLVLDKDIPWTDMHLSTRKSIKPVCPSLLVISRHALPYDSVDNTSQLFSD